MCGIAGFFNPSSASTKITDAELTRMTESMVHRGPDAHGVVFKSNWGLGHRRLKIIDLSDNANQPMFNESRKLCLVFNGEIYNYKKLRDELVKLGYQFKTSSDTEVILYSYEKWGEECFEKFNGMFAIAIFDSEREKLTLAVDRLGKKPIYYIIKDGHLYFSSEIKSLLTLPYIRRTVSIDSVYLYCLFNYIPAPKSIIKGIKKINANHIITFSSHGAKIKSYWELPQIGQIHEDMRDLNYENYKEQVAFLIDDAVKIRLNSDVPLGLFLSGGVDSSLITAIASQHQNGIQTFGVVFSEDELRAQNRSEAVASYIGTNHKKLYVDLRNVGDCLMEMPKYFDEPFGDDSLIPTYFICKETRTHVTVALSGDGGDELFGGYPKYIQLNNAQRTLQIPYWVRRNIGKLLMSIPSDKLFKIGDLLESCRRPFDFLLWLSTIWKPHEVDKLLLNYNETVSTTIFGTSFYRTRTENLAEKMMAIDIETFLKDDILVKIDRASMANSLEVRSPLLDYRLVELAFQIPFEYKIRNNSSKYILKDLLSSYLPSHLYEKKKVGFNIPLKRWLKTEWRDYVEEFISEEAIRSRGLFNWTYISEIKDAFYRNDYDFSRKLFNLLMLEIWFQHYKI